VLPTNLLAGFKARLRGREKERRNGKKGGKKESKERDRGENTVPQNKFLVMTLLQEFQNAIPQWSIWSTKETIQVQFLSLCFQKKMKFTIEICPFWCMSVCNRFSLNLEF